MSPDPFPDATALPPVPPVPPGLAPVLRHWRGLCAGRTVPARTDLEPGAVRSWLTHAAILERRQTPEGIRIRLAGSGLSRLMGVEARGMPLRTLFSPGERARVHALATAAFDEGRPLLIRAWPDPDAIEDAARTVDLALMPLADATGAVTRAFLYLDMSGRRAIDTPCRLGILAAWHLPAPNDHALAPAQDLPKLRVIHGGREVAPA